ncbi:MAG: hypothetical protein HQL22_10700 [Candidatus Omnitrophica bacterium]|nr:hypothetical protein [Candidatus Omnitrophota bacterium]
MKFQSLDMYLFLSLSVCLLGTSMFARQKRQLFLALNLVFISLFFTQSRLPSMIILLLWCASHYAVLQLMLRVTWKRALFVLWLVADLAWFVLVKEYHWITRGFLSGHSFFIWWSVLGYSFILFRQIHLSVSVRDGVITAVKPLDYLNYNLAFWTFLAGPIQRYDDFVEQQTLSVAQPVPALDFLKGANRMVWGLIKMAALAPVVEKYAEVTVFTSLPNIATFVLFLAAFPLYLYLNFSGYCDVMLGLGRMVGFRLPENFRMPFAARNMVDFWSRWHISLSEFFRDYLYFPMVTSASRRFNPLASMLAATLISFLLMGIWHGNTIRFAVFGALHGIGVIVTLLYGEFLKAVLSREQLKAYRQNSAVRVMAIIVCQLYVLAAFLVFQYSYSDLSRVLNVLKGHG